MVSPSQPRGFPVIVPRIRHEGGTCEICPASRWASRKSRAARPVAVIRQVQL